jgi:hypothetical protein
LKFGGAAELHVTFPRKESSKTASNSEGVREPGTGTIVFPVVSPSETVAAEGMDPRFKLKRSSRRGSSWIGSMIQY